MKKRLISLFVALTMLLCLIPAAFAATFNAGTYTASAKGMNGAVTVEVTFSDSAITDVKVTEQAETPAIASGALEQIPADIVAHQTLAVDPANGGGGGHGTGRDHHQQGDSGGGRGLREAGGR